MINFVVSLIMCAAAMLFLQTKLLKGVSLNILTVTGIVFAWIYFIAVPIGHIASDTYVDVRLFIEEPIVSLTRLNFFNAVLLVIAGIAAHFTRPPREREPRPLHFEAAIPALIILLAVQIAWGFYTIYYSGNVLTLASGRLELQGSLLQYAVFESAPLAFCWLVTLLYAKAGRKPGGMMIGLILLIEILLLLGLSSSRGARVAMLSQLVFCVQIFNYSIYRFKLRDYVIGAVLTAFFLPIYANYKYGGVEALRDYISGGGPSSITEHYNDPMLFLAGDIGRADGQAPLLSRYLEGSFTPNYVGETYLGALTLLLPRDQRPDWPRSKVVIGAEAQLDRGTGSRGYRGVVQVEGVYTSSRIYGLAGETILNFGIWGLPFAFWLFGFLTRKAYLATQNVRTWRQLLTAPYLSFVPIFLLFYDFDNILVQTLSIWAIPYLTLVAADFLSPRRSGRTAYAA